IPGFNGFASKWLIIQSSLLAGFQMPLMVFLGIVAVFISAITWASFVKFLGFLFLGPLRVEASVERRDVPWSMAVPQWVLAAFCVLFGVVPLLPLRYLHQTVATALSVGHGSSFHALFGDSVLNVSLSIGQHGIVGAWGPAMVLVAFAGCLLLAYLLSRLGGARVRDVPVWLCGGDYLPEQVTYRVHGFLLPVKRASRWLYPSAGASKPPPAS
ncbi:MAG: hypothetical protein AB7Y46_20220, partial [Armatimonadota bacterium]